jgi:hypothetical protein
MQAAVLSMYGSVNHIRSGIYVFQPLLLSACMHMYVCIYLTLAAPRYSVPSFTWVWIAAYITVQSA